jgi:hypothetical protein
MGGSTALDATIIRTKDTFDALVDILRYTKEVGDVFPPLKSAAAGILVIIDAIKVHTLFDQMLASGSSH